MAETQETPSLTYEEIGERLVECVDSGVITRDQAIEIGNHLFPITEEEPQWNGPR